MKKFTKLTAIVLVLLALPSANAQMGRGGPPQFHGVWTPVVGQGAIYQHQKAGTNKNMEVAVLGKESVDGKDGYWVEIAFDAPEMGGQMVMKSLMVLDTQQIRVVKMIMQMPGKPPMEMPTQMTQRNIQNADIRSDAQDLGSESVTVPAGTFTCEHYKTKDGTDVWTAKDVPPWGMVKYQGKDDAMVLTKLISNPKDKITGTPQPFNPMNMGQRPPQ